VMQVGTQTSPHRTASTRWRILLPLIMTLSATILMLWAKKQEPMLRKMGTGWEVPARVINSLINGPGFYFGRLIPLPIPSALNEWLTYDAGRISGSALFWFLIGVSIDRRLNKQSLDSQKPVRAGVLFTFVALVSMALCVGAVLHTFCPSPILCNAGREGGVGWEVFGIVAKFPLRAQYSVDLGLALWLFAFSTYFTRRAFIAARRSLATTK
jgi:hypothetical protein